MFNKQQSLYSKDVVMKTRIFFFILDYINDLHVDVNSSCY